MLTAAAVRLLVLPFDGFDCARLCCSPHSGEALGCDPFCRQPHCASYTGRLEDGSDIERLANGSTVWSAVVERIKAYDTALTVDVLPASASGDAARARAELARADVVIGLADHHFIIDHTFQRAPGAISSLASRLHPPPSAEKLANDKGALLDRLRARGVPIVPSASIALDASDNSYPSLLRSAALAGAKSGWIAKPSPSFGSRGVARVYSGDELIRYVRAVAADAANGARYDSVIVQPFKPELVSRVQLALYYFQGEYAYTAVRGAGMHTKLYSGGTPLNVSVEMHEGESSVDAGWSAEEANATRVLEIATAAIAALDITPPPAEARVDVACCVQGSAVVLEVHLDVGEMMLHEATMSEDAAIDKRAAAIASTALDVAAARRAQDMTTAATAGTSVVPWSTHRQTMVKQSAELALSELMRAHVIDRYEDTSYAGGLATHGTSRRLCHGGIHKGRCYPATGQMVGNCAACKNQDNTNQNICGCSSVNTVSRRKGGGSYTTWSGCACRRSCSVTGGACCNPSGPAGRYCERSGAKGSCSQYIYICVLRRLEHCRYTHPRCI